MNKEQFDDFVDIATSSKSGSRPFSQIVQEIVNHLTEIVRSEIRLARVEVRQDFAQFTNASAFLGIGAVFALYAFGFVLLGLVYAISTTLAPWLSAVIVGLGVGLFAAIFLLVGRKKMKHADLKPVKTINSVQENVTWMKKRVT
jgi:uncharacterized membrane protein YqjE